MMASVAAEESQVDEGDAAEVLAHRLRYRGAAVPIQEIREEEKKITVQGAVSGLDTKELRNGSTLFTFNVTDFSDSIAMKDVRQDEGRCQNA